ncbi:MAG: ribonuclease T2 [Paracoccus sp. (in: a-proteobacteria)]|uniref:ribonuclease T2 n=1 Tax=Paracoccus sp. TaxID=267 RepID=UPI0026E09CEC|nr:ribonuclease T2 [Paracoccus sp. (in: a-proteobacteria)]MDO5612035.1 ribonuclease T2 [Paracoccus sp. (in: a-proteobacteria)]
MAGKWIMALTFAGALAGTAAARDVAGQFDYYVLALSWSPSWCASTGDDRGADQCATGQRIGFVVHGLWPQYERGWPERCATGERDPSRRESQAMADIMGSGGLAWYQWQKHGRCSGLSARGYYATTRQALDKIAIPQVFSRLNKDIRLPPAVVEDAFIEANPNLSRDGITVTCRDSALQEVRICLTRDLEPRDCAMDTRRDCPLPAVTMAPPR